MRLDIMLNFNCFVTIGRLFSVDFMSLRMLINFMLIKKNMYNVENICRNLGNKMQVTYKKENN